MNNKYITLSLGNDFRQIARDMTNAGWSMNHATARNVFMTAMAILIKDVASQVGKPLSEEELFLILKNQDTYDSLTEVLEQAYTLHKQEENQL